MLSAPSRWRKFRAESAEWTGGPMARRIKTLGMWIVLLGAVALSPPLPAQQGGEQDPQVLLEEMAMLQQELMQAQEAAMANNPELREQGEQLQDRMLAAMRAEGFEPMRSLDRIEQLERQLQSEDADTAGRSDLIAELHDEQQNLLMAEQAAMQNPEVQQAREQFMTALLQAMREENPRTDEMIGSLKDKNAQLQEIVTARSGQR